MAYSHQAPQFIPVPCLPLIFLAKAEGSAADLLRLKWLLLNLISNNSSVLLGVVESHQLNSYGNMMKCIGTHMDIWMMKMLMHVGCQVTAVCCWQPCHSTSAQKRNLRRNSSMVYVGFRKPYYILRYIELLANPLISILDNPAWKKPSSHL